MEGWNIEGYVEEGERVVEKDQWRSIFVYSMTRQLHLMKRIEESD